MKTIKRNGAEEAFDIKKIIAAVKKANESGDKNYLNEEQIVGIAEYVEYKCEKLTEPCQLKIFRIW
jgi:ribonucleoside-triphosphate reductase